MENKGTFRVIACILGVGLLIAYPAQKIYEKTKNPQSKQQSVIQPNPYSNTGNKEDNNSEYQVEKWYLECKQLLARGVESNAEKKALRTAQEKLVFWIQKRKEELTASRESAKERVYLDDVEYYDKELERLSEMSEEALKNTDESE